MGKWLWKKDSPRVDATPDYKCREIPMPCKTKKTLEEYTINSWTVGTKPLTNTE